MNHYETLGVPKDATQVDIKVMYRAKAQRLHPDKPGGDSNAFAALREADGVLSDPARRKRYDETGDPDEPKQDYAGSLAMLFSQIMDQGGQCNIIDEAKTHVAHALHEIDSAMSKNRVEAEKLKRHLGRVVSTGEMNLYEQMLTQKLDHFAKMEKNNASQRDLMLGVERLLDEYEDTRPEAKHYAPTGSYSTHIYTTTR